jgi:HSP20 family protein
MNRMNRLFRESYSPESPDEAFTTTSFAPPVDVCEDEHNTTSAKFLALTKKTSMSASRTAPSPSVASARSRRKRKRRTSVASSVERHYGSFTRSFTLPSSVDSVQVTAHYDKGELKINLAKKAEAKPKQIKINVGSKKTLEAKIQNKAA